ncbi:MAG: hypothetical protein HQK64_02630 [Desulfamplus sp.]|nr:hypothetical protein [Desulfamplus sp.]MBF0241357.1 hypothetical protein [Desulfamplus sp.]
MRKICQIKYDSMPVFIDANLLLLFYIGLINKKYIPEFKRTKTYQPEDFELLYNFLNNVPKIVTTPNILTEVCNLASCLSGKYKNEFSNVFANSIAVMEECYIKSTDAIKTDEFFRFGLVDSIIINFVKGKYLLLTDDFRLSQYAESIGIAVLNFNHIRQANWGL